MGQNASRGVHEVSFADGAIASGEIDLTGNKVAAIYIPSGFDPLITTFKVYAAPKAGMPYLPCVDDAGTTYSIAVTAGTTVCIDAAAMAVAGPRHIVLQANQAVSGAAILYLLSTN